MLLPSSSPPSPSQPAPGPPAHAATLQSWTLPCGYVVTRRRDGLFLEIDPDTEKLLGCAPGTAVGRTACELGLYDNPALREMFLHQAGIAHAPAFAELNLRASDGTVLILLIATRPVERDGETCLHTQLIDISDRKRAETERDRLQTKLIQVQKMEAIGQLASGVAHDFNNLITAILIYVDLLRGLPAMPPAAQKVLTEMDRTAHSAIQLTRQLLLFSRRQTVEMRSLELGSQIVGVLQMLARLIGSHIQLDYRSAPEPLWIFADHTMIEQIVMNLVVNARDALPRGGQIQLSTRQVTFASDALPNHANARPGAYACLEVADNGEGMDEATRQSIFEPFFTTKETGKGTGLGLTTVQHIVHRHAGWMTVASELDRGTTFEVYLPIDAGVKMCAE